MEVFLFLSLVIVVVAWLGVVFVGPPFVPTLQRDLKKLFAELELTKDDHVVDLGAGDGRVLRLSARYGAKASGVELNPFLVWFARFRSRHDLVRVVQGNMWRYVLPKDTTYVFAFSAHSFLHKLERYLEDQVELGRSFQLISYGFSFDDREPDRVIGAFNLYVFRPRPASGRRQARKPV